MLFPKTPDALLILLLALSPSAKSQAAHEFGQQIFQTHCASCHGDDGKGLPSLDEAMLSASHDLTRLAARNGGKFPAARVYGVIDGREILKAHGLREMPIWGNYFSAMAPAGSDENRQAREAYVRRRIVSLINYLEYIQR